MADWVEQPTLDSQQWATLQLAEQVDKVEKDIQVHLMAQVVLVKAVVVVVVVLAEQMV
jgi:hypothetical protein